MNWLYKRWLNVKSIIFNRLTRRFDCKQNYLSNTTTQLSWYGKKKESGDNFLVWKTIKVRMWYDTLKLALLNKKHLNSYFAFQIDSTPQTHSYQSNQTFEWNINSIIASRQERTSTLHTQKLWCALWKTV